MKWYPWLIKPYKKIIRLHERKKAHHAILIKTQKGMGVFKLVWFISKWLLCLKPKGTNFCDNCHGCKLMSANNHPDWHTIINEKNDVFDVDSIRVINEKIFKRAQQGNNKIIFLPNVHKLTESAVNALLKILEEPPEKNWFFLIDYNYLKLHSTLKSRCFLYRLPLPLEKESLNWLKNNNKKDNISNLTSLRINQDSPISAKNFIESDLWDERKNLYKSLSHSIKDKNLLKILPVLCKKNTIMKIDWICLLLFDAVKTNFNERKKLINCDQIKLINFFSKKYNNILLNKSIRKWTKCRYILSSVSSINSELLLLEQLLLWEKILCFITP
ncbi:DNA polymerase III subunit delta' [Buchnera aphidicola (Schizaphis graminum)]|uniref:DNA polymerase III subunit delta' n=2 Tax=Buchnera aphidicola TaxID=9 RepID=HOLB_BUCAP|nr:RecName: Full=DNA polymerase III subunit delta' [Buchnera aphidicola str. Sg (Schizaphis graminum)]AAM67896.1 DNA polymerase III delta' subunit [Buchnera aphidicola str. Sg (Schizaphis graminum)]AWI49610.1 DNA polymerase III subunit delta' [Buchnera aphidicola (Schizaphis graminum)]